MNNLSGSQSIRHAAPLSVQSLKALVRTMRPRQWIKNVFVFAAIAFSEDRLWYTEPLQLLRVIGAFIAFSMAASAIYLINDLVDIEKDRAHPKKRHRPLAAGVLSPTLAAVTAAFLMIAVFPLALWIDYDFDFALILAVYVIVQGFLYSFWLKNIVIFDILTIAAGFILRAIAGAAVIDIVITPWLIICMGLLALFLGIGKRRHELKLLEEGAGNHRRILNEYSIPLLDQMQAIVTASIVIAYSMTAFSAPVVPKEPFPMLMITIPFVVYAIFRYLYLIHKHDGGGAPEELVLQDRPLALSIVLWGITVLSVLIIFPS